MKKRIEKINGKFFLDYEIETSSWKNWSVYNTLAEAEKARDSLVDNPTLTERLSAAMLLLAEIEPHIDEWNFPITMRDRITALCDKHFGGVRPSFE
jgi:hypothetical protein